MRYQIPEEYYCRLHHIRPRFKNNIENVLIYMATEISKIRRKSKREFDKEVNKAIKKFPGNATKKIKTINNWRTEISSLFGFIRTSRSKDKSWPALRATELADKQDLVHSFKLFLYHFQYPGGHLKPHENAEVIRQGIKFRPAPFILKLLHSAEKNEKTRKGITKPELTHCVFNDLRVTRDGEGPESVWERIKENRKKKVQYDCRGDVIRYAGDILDYMVTANLLTPHGQKYFINTLEKNAVQKFMESKDWFSKYDRYIDKRNVTLAQINSLQEAWFEYVNMPREEIFETDALAFIARDETEYAKLRKQIVSSFMEKLEEPSEIGTKEIGDVGENLVHGHECMRIKLRERTDLIHLIRCIPDHLAAGYDIRSVEADATYRYIEVKTTISNSEIDFTRIHLTPVEWTAADTLKSRYFVYRLLLSKRSRKLFLLRDPVGQYKQEKLSMTPRNGADIVFSPARCGEYTELLEWRD
ncbi:MAG: DUF3883 domain-containing protein [Candidatus Omnitrophota bacterium]|nr:MAG: DUF3883 domain-containing protein [Candidatus Omnitrophota bacterium]